MSLNKEIENLIARGGEQFTGEALSFGNPPSYVWVQVPGRTESIRCRAATPINSGIVNVLYDTKTKTGYAFSASAPRPNRPPEQVQFLKVRPEGTTKKGQLKWLYCKPLGSGIHELIVGGWQTTSLSIATDAVNGDFFQTWPRITNLGKDDWEVNYVAISGSNTEFRRAIGNGTTFTTTTVFSALSSSLTSTTFTGWGRHCLGNGFFQTYNTYVPDGVGGSSGSIFYLNPDGTTDTGTYSNTAGGRPSTSTIYANPLTTLINDIPNSEEGFPIDTIHQVFRYKAGSAIVGRKVSAGPEYDEGATSYNFVTWLLAVNGVVGTSGSALQATTDSLRLDSGGKVYNGRFLFPTDTGIAGIPNSEIVTGPSTGVKGITTDALYRVTKFDSNYSGSGEVEVTVYKSSIAGATWQNASDYFDFDYADE